MATTHRIIYTGAGTARVLIDDRPPITIVGGGERGVTLSGKTHEITYAIADQAGDPWGLAVTKNGKEQPVWQRKGKVPNAGLEVGGDEFGD